MPPFLRLRHISVVLICCRVSLANRKRSFSCLGAADAQAADPKRHLSSSICFNIPDHTHKGHLCPCHTKHIYYLTWVENTITSNQAKTPTDTFIKLDLINCVVKKVIKYFYVSVIYFLSYVISLTCLLHF